LRNTLGCSYSRSPHHAHRRGAQVYDHISQGSPNLLSPERETYRRAAAVTAVREGSNDHVPYLYTLNFACPSETWDDMEPVFRKVSPMRVWPACCSPVCGMSCCNVETAISYKC